MRKYCRACWNTKYWREPTGEAARIEVGQSYVQQNGFGHEEWLFNFSWLQPGPNGTRNEFKYGFLQPIGKYKSAYEGKTFDILVYAVTPTKARVAVAIIKDAYVPLDSEISSALRVMRKRGWIKEMGRELGELGISHTAFEEPTINVRFRPADVTFYDPPIVFPKSHKLYRINRYQPIDWNDAFPPKAGKPAARAMSKKGKKQKSEDERVRTSIDGTTYSPLHDRLQNRLYDHLCSLHGKASVSYEKDWVDLSFKTGGKTTFIEIKIAPTAKSCIRQALGQLLEYGMYPTEQRAEKLVVVGDGEASADDKAYLRYLRKTFGMPIYYRRWDWQGACLDGEH